MAKARKRKKPIAKSGFVQRNLETSIAKLAVAASAVDTAVAVRTKAAKKNLNLVKRLGKRKVTLSKRKKLAAVRLAKAPGKDTRAALKTVTRDLAKTVKELTKARAVKKANSAELSLLRASQRRTKAYSKAIAQVDKGLAKKKR